MQEQNFEDHYTNLGQSYNENERRHDEHVREHMEYLSKHLKCEPYHKVVEVGAGTCICSRELIDIANIKESVLCVDYSASMLKNGENLPYIKTLHLDGLSFSKLDMKYDRIFLRAALHNFGKEVIPEFLSNVYKQLNEGGIFVNIAMHGCDNRPWFKKLKEVFPITHISAEYYMEELKKAGFDEVSNHVERTNVAITKQSLFKTFRQRYVTLFEFISDDEIEEGITEIEEQYPKQEVIKFVDLYDFTVAKK